MKLLNKPKILQVLPGGGWSAVYPHDEEGSPLMSPLIAWALVEDEEGEQSLVGIHSEGNYTEFVYDGSSECEEHNFWGYAEPGTVVDDEFRKLTSDWYQHKKREEEDKRDRVSRMKAAANTIARAGVQERRG